MLSEISSIVDLVQKFRLEKHCIDHLERIRWRGKVVSPFDAGSKVYKCKYGYKCKTSGKYFNVRTGTIFEGSKIPLFKWFIALYLFSSHKKGISSYQLSKDIGVTQKSAWFILHRLRYAFDHPEFMNMMGRNPVEIDECYIGGKEKNKHRAKRSGYTQGRSDSKQVVLGLFERGGYVSAHKIKSAKAEDIYSVISESVESPAIIYTDDFKVYRNLKNYNIHFPINHSRGKYVEYGVIHTNTIEGFWSWVKRGILGIYHHTSSKHLQSYLYEFALRYNTRYMIEGGRFNLILENMGVRLRYLQLTC